MKNSIKEDKLTRKDVIMLYSATVEYITLLRKDLNYYKSKDLDLTIKNIQDKINKFLKIRDYLSLSDTIIIKGISNED